MGSTPDFDRMPTIYDHTSNPHQSLLPGLQAHLPYSIPLLRRIQFEITGKTIGSTCSTARFLATFPVDTDVKTLQRQQSKQGNEPECENAQQPWLAAFVDLYSGRETQAWVYSSLEASASFSASRSSSLSEGVVIGSVISTTASPSLASSSLSLTSTSRGKPAVPITTFSHLPHSAREVTRMQLLSLLYHVQTSLQPEYIASLNNSLSSSSSSPSPSSSSLSSTTKESPPSTPKHIIPPAPPGTILIGSLHTGLLALLKKSQEYHDSEITTVTSLINGERRMMKVKIHRYDAVPYGKYVFTSKCWRKSCGTSPSSTEGVGDHSRQKTVTDDLPDGYRFTNNHGERKGLQEYQTPLVISRTHIPRSKRTLVERMRSVVIYHDPPSALTAVLSSAPADTEVDLAGVEEADKAKNEKEMPVAWCFLALDASLATLHVESEHRGKGIAGLLMREMMRWGMDDDRSGRRFWVRDAGPDEKEALHYNGDQDSWAHSDVSIGNIPSRRVMEKLGGELTWTVTWTVVDLLES